MSSPIWVPMAIAVFLSTVAPASLRHHDGVDCPAQSSPVGGRILGRSAQLKDASFQVLALVGS